MDQIFYTERTVASASAHTIGAVHMHIAVLGAGSWGTTVASLLAGRHDCTVWARDPELAREIYERDANSRYLPGFALPSALKATADLE